MRIALASAVIASACSPSNAPTGPALQRSATPTLPPNFARPLRVSDALFTIPKVSGYIVPAGDFDGDGIVDLVVSRRIGPRGIALVSTAERRMLRILAPWASAWSVGGRLDLDRAPDLLIARRSEQGLNEVVAVAGSNGDVLWSRPVSGAQAETVVVCFVDDLDGDGVTDYALGVSQNPRVGLESLPGRLDSSVVDGSWVHFVVSKDGTQRELRSILTENLDARGGPPGRLSLHSGRTGEELWNVAGERAGHAFARRIVSVPDLDGDGKRDVIAQPARESSTPVLVCSSADGRTLLRLENLGGDVSPAGDLNGDGVGDLFRDEVQPAMGGYLIPRVQMLDGKTGAVLFDLPYPDRGSEHPFPVALGDLDGDGVDDLALSDAEFNLGGGNQLEPDFDLLSLADAALLESQPWNSAHLHSGCVIVYSGRTRAPLMGVWGEPGTMSGMGHGVAALPDVSSDGWPDLIVADEDTAYVFAGPGPSAAIGTGGAATGGDATDDDDRR